MNEFLNTIEIFFPNQVAEVEKRNVVAKYGQLPIKVHAIDIDLQPQTNETKAGILSSLNFTLYIDKISERNAKKLSIQRSAILLIHTVNGQSIVVGSLNYPAKVLHSQHLNSDVLQIQSNQPTPHNI